ncbi:MAG: winged helix-turn-helix transcriptional regulator [Woeseiaceae bacterium]
MARQTRSDRSSCPISYGLDLFGDRWTLLVLRDLILHGKRRFAEFLDSDEKIASNILADRLQRLEARGIIERKSDPEDARQKIALVTELGLSLTPVLLEIAAWGASHDPATGAPDGFAEAFYADREGYYRDHRARIANLFARQQ